MAENIDSPILPQGTPKGGHVADFASSARRPVFGRFGKKDFSQRGNSYNSGRWFRRKFSKRKKRHSPRFFESVRLPSLNSVFGDVSSVRYPRQFILSVYPVYDGRQFRSNKRTFRLLKKRRFPVLNGQYSIHHKSRNQNKRSANETCETVTEKTKSEEKEKETTAEDIDDSYDALDTYGPQAFLSPSPPLPPVPLSRLYNRYLDPLVPTVSFPKIEFKYPYDPEVYDASLRSDSSLTPVFKKKSQSELEEDWQAPSQPDIKKLQAMLEEVETVLKDSGSNLGEKGPKGKKTKSKEKDRDKGQEQTKKKKKKKSKKITKSKKTETSEVDQKVLKEKIDNIAIPLLTQISEALGKMSQSSECTTRPPSSASSSSASKSAKSKSKPKSKSKSSKKPTGPCSIDGTWTSSKFGIDLTFSTLPNMMIKVNVSDSKVAEINNKWSIQGLTLSRSGGPLILAAVNPHKRKVGSFLGQCKSFKDEDIIFGSWTIFTWVGKFTDLWQAVETKLDVLKKRKEAVKKESKKS